MACGANLPDCLAACSFAERLSGRVGVRGAFVITTTTPKTTTTVG